MYLLMAKKKLNEQQLNKMESLLKEGKTPEDLSNYFGVAISSIHNYKRMLKDKGIELPNIRGQRPKGIETPKESIQSLSDHDKNSILLQSYIHLIVNRTDFYVKASAKTIKVDENQISVDF